MTVKQINDTDQIVQDLTRLAAQYPEATATATYQEMRIIMDISKDQCPVEFGLLKASGWVGDPEVTDGNIEVRLGYSQKYAIHVHEMLDNYHLPPTKAKFLEDPLKVRLNFNILPNEILRRTKSIVEAG